MNKNELDDYLVRGWESGENLFYDGRIYFSQCERVFETGKYHFYVFSFKAKKYGNNMFSRYTDKNHNYIDLKDHIDRIFDTYEEAKEYYLSAKIFEGKSFWEIGMKFEWLEYGGPDIVVDD